MIERKRARDPDEAWRTWRRRAGVTAFLSGLFGALVVFAFLPGLPHVIDWGAILVSLTVGVLARWGCQSWITRAAKENAERM